MIEIAVTGMLNQENTAGRLENGVFTILFAYYQGGSKLKKTNEPRHVVCAHAQSDQNLCKSLDYFMSVKLLTEHPLEFLSLKGG